MFEEYRSIHFIGIGGIGMSGIAEVLFNLGYEVTGSDVKETETTRRLTRMGIKVQTGQRAENIGSAHVVVVSSAISPDNEEVAAARKRSIPVIPRAEMLAELGRLKYSILVAGAHGKTTATSLISSILAHSGLDPTIVIGGKLKALGSNAKLGQGKFIVAEADESDGSFLKLSPTIAVVTNIDREHMEFFRTMDRLQEAFLSFINKVPFYGLSIICAENENLRGLIPRIEKRFLTYGFADSSDIRAVDIEMSFMKTSFTAVVKGRNLGRFSIPLPGLHNVLNALACIAVSLELHVAPSAIREALGSFGGIQRRFEFKGEEYGVMVYDDYGHHPAEIRATLAAARENIRYLEGDRELFVVFQPHRYSRTASLMSEFSEAFGDSDHLIVIDIYPAGEAPIEGVTSQVLADDIRRSGHKDVTYSVNADDAVQNVLSRIRKGDILLTLGAGNVWKLGEKILERLHAA